MSLRNLDIRIDYNKTHHSIADEFYLPCLRNAIKYDRLSGYFSSYVYSLAWEGVRSFIENNGVIRVICSSYLSREDLDAMSYGYEYLANTAYNTMIHNELLELLANDTLSKPTRLISCLIGMNRAQFKLAILNNDLAETKRMFHDKVGIFTDENSDSVVFRGSMNESHLGLSPDGNIESISVYKSWGDDNDSARAINAITHFDKLWSDKVSSVNIVDFSEVIVNLTTDKYPDDSFESLIDETIREIELTRKWSIKSSASNIRPFPHQLKALTNWEANYYRGVFEHATGSGKTITGLCAIKHLLSKGYVAIVLVPSLELLDQWHREIKRILNSSVKILVCGGKHKRWLDPECLEAWSRNSGTSERIILSTIDTAVSDKFLRRVVAGGHLFLLVDEVHRIGSPQARKFLDIDTGARLGLSATPKRFGDYEGTSQIFNYFGTIIPPSFSIGDAIAQGVLTKYIYIPNFIHLNCEEQLEWDKYTIRINRYLSVSKDDNNDIVNDEYLKKLLVQRSRIIKNATEKPQLALNVIKEHYGIGQKWLIYCDNQTQLNQVIEILGNQGYQACEYHSNMAGDRQETMKQFILNGGILVSIKCLDEGVDIPSASHALILASSKNPREFIQRRGRVLRKFENKHFAYIHDAIVLPNTLSDGLTNSITNNELSRCLEFSRYAANSDCQAKIELKAIEYDVDLLNLSEGGYEDE